MGWGVLHTKVVPDEFFQVREVEVEVIVKGATSRDADGHTLYLVSAICDERHGSRQILEECALFG